MKNVLGALLIFTIIFTSSCIFGPTARKVMSYRNGLVYLSDRSVYNIGTLPSDWKRMKVTVHSIAFHSNAYEATIATDAWCGRAYDDAPLASLASRMIGGIENYQIQDTYDFMLNERGALRTIATGTMDGVPLTFDTVVIKKDKCIFDFMCISSNDGYPMAVADFQTFFSDFHYDAKRSLR